jgi:ABC-type lipoprotein release transport system permease subunit
LQVSIEQQFESGLSTDTLMVIAGSGGLVGGGGSSGFQLLANYSETIEGLSSDVVYAIPVIQRNGHIQSGDQVLEVTIIGVDFEKYASVYTNTFAAQAGTIPVNPSNDMLVIGSEISAPSQNQTIIINAG